MYWPIHLDHQASLWAVEIYDIAINRMLPPEFQTLHLPVAQMLPQFFFRLS